MSDPAGGAAFSTARIPTSVDFATAAVSYPLEGTRTPTVGRHPRPPDAKVRPAVRSGVTHAARGRKQEDYFFLLDLT